MSAKFTVEKSKSSVLQYSNVFVVKSLYVSIPSLIKSCPLIIKLGIQEPAYQNGLITCYFYDYQQRPLCSTKFCYKICSCFPNVDDVFQLEILLKDTQKKRPRGRQGYRVGRSFFFFREGCINSLPHFRKCFAGDENRH